MRHAVRYDFRDGVFCDIYKLVIGIADADERRLLMEHPSTDCYIKHREAILREGLPVNIWTVNDEALMRKLSADGVNGIFTDNPALMK